MSLSKQTLTKKLWPTIPAIIIHRTVLTFKQNVTEANINHEIVNVEKRMMCQN